MTMFFFLRSLRILLSFFFFFFNDTATTEIYTLSLHDALPISKEFIKPIPYEELQREIDIFCKLFAQPAVEAGLRKFVEDRKSTRLNSSHLVISYAVFCLKKKKKK